MSEYIHCPRCGGAKIYETDYEIPDPDSDDATYIVDEDGRGCEDCGWEGDVSELVSKD